jgi:hypothetical protein
MCLFLSTIDITAPQGLTVFKQRYLRQTLGLAGQYGKVGWTTGTCDLENFFDCQVANVLLIAVGGLCELLHD